VPESIDLGSDNPGGGKSLSETSVFKGASVPVFQSQKGVLVKIYTILIGCFKVDRVLDKNTRYWWN